MRASRSATKTSGRDVASGPPGPASARGPSTTVARSSPAVLAMPASGRATSGLRGPGSALRTPEAGSAAGGTSVVIVGAARRRTDSSPASAAATVVDIRDAARRGASVAAPDDEPSARRDAEASAPRSRSDIGFARPAAELVNASSATAPVCCSSTGPASLSMKRCRRGHTIGTLAGSSADTPMPGSAATRARSEADGSPRPTAPSEKGDAPNSAVANVTPGPTCLGRSFADPTRAPVSVAPGRSVAGWSGPAGRSSERACVGVAWSSRVSSPRAAST